MRGLRTKLTYANVVATLSIVLVLTGGTALASVLITSNGQVAKDTISGHKPPSGKHSNVIAGSINGRDVADDSLGGADINESSLTGIAMKLDYTAPASNNPETTIAQVGPYTIKARCTPAFFGVQARVALLVNGPAGTADIMWSEVGDVSVDNGNHSAGMLIPADTDTAILGLARDNNGYLRAGGRAILRAGDALVQIDFEATANATGQACFVYGTATSAT
ncbi:MAG TPA: hypothetical protein VNN79_20950 [Actinomycetota bacterium]|nr:hypothetical protein [Actinomycetota bacterium]